MVLKFKIIKSEDTILLFQCIICRNYSKAIDLVSKVKEVLVERNKALVVVEEMTKMIVVAVDAVVR